MKGKSRPLDRKPPVRGKGSETAKTIGELIIADLLIHSHAEGERFSSRRG